jgi:hypothetical protein
MGAMLNRKIVAIFVVISFLASVLLAAPMAFAADSEEEVTSSSLTVSAPSAIVDITLSNVPINWGTLSSGTENNLAQVNAGNPATLKVESTTNVNVDIYIKGTDWSDGSGHTITAGNAYYDNDNIAGGAKWTVLNTSYAAGPDLGFWEDITPGTSENSYWFMDIPAGQWAATYSNNIYFKAVKDGTLP